MGDPEWVSESSSGLGGFAGQNLAGHEAFGSVVLCGGSGWVGQVGWVRLAKGADAPSWIQGVIRWYMNSRKGTALCIAGLGTMRQKQYEDVPGAPALRPKGRYDPRRGCLPIFQMPCHQQSDDASVCPILNSAKTQFLHPQSRV